jgi:hypothetical protein
MPLAPLCRRTVIIPSTCLALVLLVLAVTSSVRKNNKGCCPLESLRRYPQLLDQHPSRNVTTRRRHAKCTRRACQGQTPSWRTRSRLSRPPLTTPQGFITTTSTGARHRRSIMLLPPRWRVAWGPTKDLRCWRPGRRPPRPAALPRRTSGPLGGVVGATVHRLARRPRLRH